MAVKTDHGTVQSGHDLQDLKNTASNGSHREFVEDDMVHSTHEDAAFEKALLRKTDRNVIPVLFLLFLCAYIDRSVTRKTFN